MLDQLTVTPIRLADAATNIRTAAQAIDDILERLDDEAKTLRAEWSGEAQIAFDASRLRFSDALESRTEAVRKICAALSALADGYSQIDLESARALGATS
ncbi:WXG100 family type VII secretion target [Microbacterium sp. SORGH_AS_0862]|uniref:WXG100 family type VII secretion target n=1 Tax=Microbacterium sp. SORGH_AS_0862 TaxID=3041789 RepID=UPI002793D49C|nr:WXG100 family type VII secretion target [Microbacterium sp. SORGH_AS_0862]MDQ1203717.1 early secretory antigenic target protein ESAT-6 [Microbacterium sp. SORGH_AS_0862]